ncbi:MAG TPA: thioredoxin [Steroidobacteraceae bacterium]
MSASVKAVSTATFPSEVINASSSQPVLVDFWAPWCGPCRMLGPVLEQVADEHAGAVKVVKVNTDENQDIAQQYQIRSIPAVKLFRNGRVVDEFIGAVPVGHVRRFLEPHLPRASAGEQDAARRLAETGDYAGAIAKLQTLADADPGNLAARRDLARYFALSGDVVGASRVLGQLPPAAQNDPASNAVRALIHFAALATDDAARSDSLRAGAARSILGGSPDAAVETLLTRMQGDRNFATRAGREDLLQAFALLPADDARLNGWRRRLAALLN